MRRREFRVVPVVLVLLLAVQVAGQESLPTVPAVRQGPTVDGNLSDAVWKESLVLELGYADRDRPGKPECATTVRLLTDSANFYFGFRSEETHLEGPYLKDADDKRSVGDHVKVVLDLGRYGFYEYYLLMGHPVGSSSPRIWFGYPYQQGTGAVRTFDDWRKPEYDYQAVTFPTFQAGSKTFKGYWTVEMKIAFKELLLAPGEGMPRIIGANFYRTRWGEDRIGIEERIKMEDGGPAYCQELYKKYVTAWQRIARAERVGERSGNANYLWGPNSLWMGYLRLQVGKIDNKLVTGKSSNLLERELRTGGYTREEADLPRMERWEDLRYPYPKGGKSAPVVMIPPPDSSRAVARFSAKPTAEVQGRRVKISFGVTSVTDVTVSVLNGKGQSVRHLAAGVLGKNAPAPLKPGTLAQTILWDGTDDADKPLPAGRYTVRVSLGLAPKLDYILTQTKLGRSPWPSMVAGGHLGAQPSGQASGADRYLFADPKTEELYVGGKYVFDGNSGKFLRELEFKERFSLQHIWKVGEIVVGLHDYLYLGTWDDLRRYDKQGQPVPFAATGRHIIPRIMRGHHNPHRGHFIGPGGDLYLIHHYTPHGNTESQVTQIDPEGRIKRFGFIEIPMSAAGVKVDRNGNVYVGCAVRPADAPVPSELASRVTEAHVKAYQFFYGSVVKFGRDGGRIVWDEKGNLLGARANKLRRCRTEGAVWVRPWLSPVLTRSQAVHCSCESPRFDLDGFGRLFIPDALQARITVADSNGNTIVVFGEYGKAEKESALKFGWPLVVTVSETACYVGDSLHRQVIKLKLHYKTEAQTTVKL